jgi:hypothetical protein
LVILVVLMGIESPKEPAEFLFLQGIWDSPWHYTPPEGSS